MDLAIRSLTPALIDDFLQFFDHDAFADNPDWSGCYCQFYLIDHQKENFDSRASDQNRAEACQRISDGCMHGYLAYLDGRVVGWCNAAPQRLFPALMSDPDLPHEEAEQTGSIVCFLVDYRLRGRGVAKQLLEAACDGFAKAGLRWAEVYPRLHPQSQSADYHGPLRMYEEAGFEVFQQQKTYAIVRKALG